jgi:hypothetical protein
LICTVVPDDFEGGIEVGRRLFISLRVTEGFEIGALAESEGIVPCPNENQGEPKKKTRKANTVNLLARHELQEMKRK